MPEPTRLRHDSQASPRRDTCRVAVVTPVCGESREIIARCIETVRAQQSPPALHILVVDGAEDTLPTHSNTADLAVIPLPRGCEDTGASPRSIGAIYAVAQGCDAIAFLDADNTWAPTHLGDAIDLHYQGADITYSDRWICHHTTRERMYRDTKDSSRRLIDTNTLVLFARALPTATEWWRVPRTPGVRTAGVDRYFLDRIREAVSTKGLRVAATGNPTVNYRSRWTDHYSGMDCDPPSPAKRLVEKDGIMFAQMVFPARRVQGGTWQYREEDLAGHDSRAIPPNQYLFLIGPGNHTATLRDSLSSDARIVMPDTDHSNYFLSRGGPPIPLPDFEKRWGFDSGTHTFAVDVSENYLADPGAGAVPGNIYMSGLRPHFIFVEPDQETAEQFGGVVHFANLLRRYCRFFPRSSILVIQPDECVAHSTTTRVTRFLESRVSGEGGDLPHEHAGCILREEARFRSQQQATEWLRAAFH